MDYSDNLHESVVNVVKENQEEKNGVSVVEESTSQEEETRFFAKRTNEDTAMSAKERYLACKRAKLSQPTISTDDE